MEVEYERDICRMDGQKESPYVHGNTQVCSYYPDGIFCDGRAYFVPAMLIGIAFGVAAYFVNLNTNLEYEYLYVDKELTVDKVMAKSRRKRVAVFDVGKMEILAPVKSWHLDNYKNRQDKRVDYSSGEEKQPDKRYVFFYDGQKQVIIEPNLELVKAIAMAAPRKVFTD